MSNPQSVIALCTCLISLAGCDSDAINAAIKNLTGEVQSLKAERSDLFDQLADKDATEAELAAIRQRLAELALGIGDGVSEPSQESSVEMSQPPTAGEECVTIWRVQTCEAGVLHHLGPNMEWID